MTHAELARRLREIAQAPAGPDRAKRLENLANAPGVADVINALSIPA